MDRSSGERQAPGRNRSPRGRRSAKACYYSGLGQHGTLNKWYHGADYQAALEIGDKYATFRRYAVEGQ